MRNLMTEDCNYKIDAVLSKFSLNESIIMYVHDSLISKWVKKSLPLNLMFKGHTQKRQTSDSLPGWKMTMNVSTFMSVHVSF